MSADINCSWHFREFREGEDNLQGANDPIIQKFKENFYNSLVRESIQNSMDAKTGDGPIEVKYELSKVSRMEFPALFGIENHIAACKNTHSENNRARELYGPMADFMDVDELDILTISDFGTEGMPYYENNIYKNPFQAFVNSEGHSVKTTTNSEGATVSNGGSFGIGKGAYFLMSPVRSLLVSTMVNDEERHTYFEGVSRLCTHDIDGTHYYHMGFYSNDGKTPTSGADIPIPFRRELPGTSISLVGKYSDLGSNSNVEDEIEKAVISNFWLAIYNEKLIVTVGRRVKIDKENLEKKMLGHFDENGKGNPYFFFKAYTTLPDEHRYFRFELNDDEYLGHCELYVRLGDPGKKDTITCMRDMMMLIQTIPSPRQHHAGISATFICLGEPGNSNLELTEDESHTSWTEKGKQGEARKRAKALLNNMYNFIGESIDSIIGLEGDKVDITIDSINDTTSEDIVSEEGEGGNPFGTVIDTSRTIKDGFDRFSIPDSVQKIEHTEADNSGTVTSGPTQGSDAGGGIKIATGPLTKKKTNKKKKHHKPGAGQKDGDEGDNNVYQIIPAYFDVAAHYENQQCVHTVYIELEENSVKVNDKVYVGISVGSDSASEDIKVDILEAKVNGKKAVVDNYLSRVCFEIEDTDNITIDVIFSDNMRHSINLG